MIKTLLYIFIGGGVGCVSRYLIARITLRIYDGSFPVGTLLANVFSCLLVALLVYTMSWKNNTVDKNMYLMIIVGFCGGLSTFSTFSLETFELIKQGHLLYAFSNVALSLLFGLGAVYILYQKSL